jgi:hypothetical protein
MNNTIHYHVYMTGYGGTHTPVGFGKFTTKAEAIRMISKLKKECREFDGEQFEGQVRYGCLESKEWNNRYIYGKKHDSNCKQIGHNTCLEEQGVEVMGFTYC